MKLVNNFLSNQQNTSNNNTLHKSQNINTTPDQNEKSAPLLFSHKIATANDEHELSTKLDNIISQFEFDIKIINLNDYNAPYIHNIFHIQRTLAYQKLQSLCESYELSTKFQRDLMKKFISGIDNKALLIFSNQMVKPYFSSLIDGTFSFFTDKALNISEAKQLLKNNDFQDLSNIIVYISIELEKSADLLIRSEFYSLTEGPPLDKRKTTKQLRQIWAKEDPKSRLIKAEDFVAENLYKAAETVVPLVVKQGLGLKDLTVMGIASFMYARGANYLLPWKFSPIFVIPSLHAIVIGYLASRIRDEFQSLIGDRDSSIEIGELKKKLHENLVVLQELNNRIDGMISECFENISDEEFNKRKNLVELECKKINNPELIFKEFHKYEQINQSEMILGDWEKCFKEIEEDDYAIIYRKNYFKGNMEDGFYMVDLS